LLLLTKYFVLVAEREVEETETIKFTCQTCVLASVPKKIYNSIDKDLNLPMNMFSRFIVFCFFFLAFCLVFLYRLRCLVKARFCPTTLLPHFEGIKNVKRSRVWYDIDFYWLMQLSNLGLWLMAHLLRGSLWFLHFYDRFGGQGHGLIFMVFDGSFTRNINDLIIDFECRGKSPLSRFMCQLLQSFSSSLHNWIKKSSQVEGKKSL